MDGAEITVRKMEIAAAAEEPVIRTSRNKKIAIAAYGARTRCIKFGEIDHEREVRVSRKRHCLVVSIDDASFGIVKPSLSIFLFQNSVLRPDMPKRCARVPKLIYQFRIAASKGNRARAKRRIAAVSSAFSRQST
jgi:hypothetical protein